jgi:hypothetical protein
LISIKKQELEKLNAWKKQRRGRQKNRTIRIRSSSL